MPLRQFVRFFLRLFFCVDYACENAYNAAMNPFISKRYNLTKTGVLTTEDAQKLAKDELDIDVSVSQIRRLCGKQIIKAQKLGNSEQDPWIIDFDYFFQNMRTFFKRKK